MSNYAPEEGSPAAAALKFIFKYSTARSSTLSCAIGMSIADIHAALAPAVEAGIIVACDVKTSSGDMKDYRPAGEAKLPAFNVVAKVEAAESKPTPTPAAAIMRELAQTQPAADPAAAAVCESVQVAAAESAPESTLQAAAPAAAAAPIATAKPVATRVRSRQADVLATLTAISPSQLTAAEISRRFPEASAAAIQQALNKLIAAGRVRTCKAETGKRGYFVPAGKAQKTPAGATAAAPTTERPATANKPHQEAAAPRSGEVQAVPTAVIQPDPVPVLRGHTEAANPFRCGVLSDGTLRIEGVETTFMGALELDSTQTTALVAYLRRLDMLGATA